MIKYYSFETKIVIYWLYDHYVEDASYNFYLNDIIVGSSNKTHFEFNKLKPGTEYKITVTEHGKYFDEIIVSTKAKKRIIDVTKKPFFAHNDGTLTTKEIQKALNSLTSRDTLYFPKGTYLTGALFVNSGSDILLAKDAVLQGSENHAHYLPKILSRFEGNELLTYASLINIGELDYRKPASTKNIIIRGEGKIIGGGNALADSIIEKESPLIDQEKEQLSLQLAAGRRRGRLINISNTSNVILDGLYLSQSPAWNIHFIYSNNIITHNCYFESNGVHNGDGWDPDSSRDCVIFGCTFNTGDDCVAIKSGRNPDGNIISIPTYNIEVFDCKSIKGHGMAIGSEVSGGIYNVNVFDCDFTYTQYGLHIKSTRKRGGYIRNINVRNCSFGSINIHRVPYNDDGPGAGYLTSFENFNFKDITISGKFYATTGEVVSCEHLIVDGFQEDPTKFNNIKLENITFFNVDSKFDYSKNISNVSNFSLTNAKCIDNL